MVSLPEEGKVAGKKISKLDLRRDGRRVYQLPHLLQHDLPLLRRCLPRLDQLVEDLPVPEVGFGHEEVHDFVDRLELPGLGLREVVERALAADRSLRSPRLRAERFVVARSDEPFKVRTEIEMNKIEISLE